MSGTRARQGAYLSLAVVGLLGTAWFNVRWGSEGGGAADFVRAGFANPASSSLAVDLLVVAATASVFMVVEGRRTGVRWVWVYVVASAVTAIAFTFPLFLAARERALDRSAMVTGPDR